MSFPVSPSDGQVAVINNVTYGYSTALKTWTRVASPLSTTSSVPPANPSVGITWYNTADDTLYRYTFDGTSYYWVDIITPTVTSNATISSSNINGNLIVTGNTNSNSVYANSYYYANGVSLIQANVTYNSVTSNTVNATTINTSSIYANSYYFANGTSLSAGGGGGAVADGVIYENSKNVASNYTITAGKNAMSAGPITINTGVTVTIPTGSRWVIV
jgi:hypothetical protein